MLTKIHENIYIADGKVTSEELREAGITVIEIVDPELHPEYLPAEMVVFRVDLYIDKINKPHIKDIACHIPKYMTQNGEKVVVMDETGLKQAPFVVARAICELESKTIYEVALEMKEVVPTLDIGKMYL